MTTQTLPVLFILHSNGDLWRSANLILSFEYIVEYKKRNHGFDHDIYYFSIIDTIGCIRQAEPDTVSLVATREARVSLTGLSVPMVCV